MRTRPAKVEVEPNAPRLLVATRFGLGIRDPAWFEHRLDLMRAVTIPSLLAQGDQAFEWVIFADAGAPSPILDALEASLARFEGRAAIVREPYHSLSLLGIAERGRLIDPEEHVLTAGIDDDDAWNRTTVAAARGRAAAWLRQKRGAEGLGFTFSTGVTWIMHDIEYMTIPTPESPAVRVTHGAGIHPTSQPWLTCNVFVCAKATSGVTAVSADHATIPEILAENQLKADVLPTPEPMWLYCRHKQSTSAPLARGQKVNDAGLGIADLTDLFGLDGTQLASYLANSAGYGNYLGKAAFVRRLTVHSALREVESEMSDPSVTGLIRAQLEREHAMLREELSQVTSRVVGDPAQIGFDHLDEECLRRLYRARENARR